MSDTYVQRNADYTARLEQLGVAILKQEFKSAAFALLCATTPGYRAQELADAVLFVRGSGLEHVIATYGLEVDPGTFREVFFNWVEHQQHHHTSVLSSAITRVDSLNGASTASSKAKA